MSHTVPKQHPAVVLRSQFVHLRGMLAIAMFAVVAMAVAIVILASAGTSVPQSASAPHSSSAPAPNGATRYDGGPEEGTRGALASPRVRTTRYDGGPVEGAAVRDTK
jgi:hypothetical protein